MDALDVTKDELPCSPIRAPEGVTQTFSFDGATGMNDDPLVYKQLAIPVSFRCLEIGSDEIEYTTRTVSIFHNGFVMSSPRRLRVGGLLSLRLRVPPEISGSPFSETRCTGYVKAEQKLKDGSLGYRVEIETALPA